MSDREIAQRLLTLRVVSDWVKAEDRSLREAAAKELVVGERVSGRLDQADADTLLGFVQLTKPRESVNVVDPDDFLDWVRRVAPTEIVTKESVRSSFAASVLADVKSHGGWISPAGELLTPDGVTIAVGQPILTVKPTAEADGLVRDAIAAQRIAIGPGRPAAPDPSPAEQATIERFGIFDEAQS